MKAFFTLLLTLSNIYTYGQLPDFESNVSDEQKHESKLFKEFGDDYKAVISFSQHSFWTIRESYYILAYDGKAWSLFNWSYILKKNGNIKKRKKELLTYNKNDLIDFLNFLPIAGFYSFNQDSLNLSKKNIGNGNMKVMQIMDGNTDRFEIFSKTGYRISTAHEPEQLQEFVKTKQRANFIKCKNKFMKLASLSSGI